MGEASTWYDVPMWSVVPDSHGDARRNPSKNGPGLTAINDATGVTSVRDQGTLPA
jgi:hypothetical protein